MKPSLFFIIPVFVALSSVSGAENLTWEKAEAEAQLRLPSLGAAEADLRAAQADRSGRLSAFYPKVESSADLGRSGSGPLGDGWGNSSGLNDSFSASYRGGFSASWKLFDGWSSLRQLEEAGLQRDAKRAALDQERVDARKRLRSSFARALQASHKVGVADDIHKRRAQAAQYQKLKFEGGRQARWIWKKAVADEAEARWRTEQARRDLEVALRDLAQALGRDSAEGLSVEGVMEVEQPAALNFEIVDRLPAMRRQRAQVLAAEARLGSLRGALWPSLGGSAGWNYSGATDWPPATRSWSLGLSAGFNLFNGGGTYFALESAEESLKALRLQETEARRGLKAGLLRAQARAQAAQSHVAVADLQLEAARERYDTMAKLGEAGRAGYLDLEQAESGFASAAEQAIDSRLEALLARADLDAALGVSFLEPGEKKP